MLMLTIVNMAKSTPAMMSHQIIGVQRNQEDIYWKLGATPLRSTANCKDSATQHKIHKCKIGKTQKSSPIKELIWQYNALWAHKLQRQGQALFSK